MLSTGTEFSLNSAFQGAREKLHEFITVEHLLLALLDNVTASRVLRACGGNVEDFCAATATAYLDEQGAAPAAQQQGRHPAHHRLPARDPARGAARAGRGQKKSPARTRLVAIYGERNRTRFISCTARTSAASTW